MNEAALWVKAPCKRFLRWWERERFTAESPCPEVLALIAYRAILTMGERSEWGRRAFAAHCGFGESVARKIMSEAASDVLDLSASRETPTVDQRIASGSPAVNQASTSNDPSGSHEDAENGRSKRQRTAKHQPAVDQQLTIESPAIIPRARVLRSEIEMEIREGDKEGDPSKSIGAVAPDPWEVLSQSLKPKERLLLPELRRFWEGHKDAHPRLRAKCLTVEQARMVIARLASFTAEDLIEASRGINHDDYSRKAGRTTELAWILSPDRIDGWIAKAVTNSDANPYGRGGNEHQYGARPNTLPEVPDELWSDM